MDSGANLLQADPISDPYISLETGPPCSGMHQLTCNCFPGEVWSFRLCYHGNRWWQLCWMCCSGTWTSSWRAPGVREGEGEGEGGREGGREEWRVEVM